MVPPPKPSHLQEASDRETPSLLSFFSSWLRGLEDIFKLILPMPSIQGLKLSGMNPPILHSQFVDDIMMMGSATAKEASTIRKILDDFSITFGISINSGKSHVFFFNTPEEIQAHLSNLLGFTWSSLPSKYLGVPLIDNTSRNSSWEPLITSLKNRLNSWNFISLNLVRHLRLLKSSSKPFLCISLLNTSCPKTSYKLHSLHSNKISLKALRKDGNGLLLSGMNYANPNIQVD
jgi:hypothetical protein